MHIISTTSSLDYIILPMQQKMLMYDNVIQCDKKFIPQLC